MVVVRRSGGEEERIATSEPMRELAKVLAPGGASAIAEVRVERPDLESVFLKLTGRSLRD